ncbi:MAG: type II toxin-antitoxin system RelE/ParE family toxin [Bdellovibrio sp.]|nr:MAG: type II toxin-antitoxin system RelE/ParE family toxin [Bdellovibrio sp.]
MTKPGNKPYQIEYLDIVVTTDIPRLPKKMKLRIKRAIEARLTLDPVGLGRPLRYSFTGHRRLRVGDYRMVYRINRQKRKVTIIAIKHRKEIYK